MGQFSWLAINTDEQIYCDDSKQTVYLLAPGKKWKEDDYEGYGRFDGKDAYQLVAELNVPEECTGDVDHDRIIGIKLACYDVDHKKLKYPIRITTDPDAKYEDYDTFCKSDPNQGWHLSEKEEECDSYCIKCGDPTEYPDEELCCYCEEDEEDEV